MGSTPEHETPHQHSEEDQHSEAAPQNAEENAKEARAVCGIVRSVAKNGGLRLVGDERWYDPTPGVVAPPELKGRTVRLLLLDDHRFCAVREEFGERDVLISRQVAVKAAAEFGKRRTGDVPDGAVGTIERLLADAAAIEAWILR